MTEEVRHPFSASPRPRVFAHRGGAALAPENTVAAFDNGLSLGADGLELDVHLSRDGAVVVHHDTTLDRTTNLRGAITAYDGAALARADAGYWFKPPVFPFRDRGISVPTLAEVLARYPDVAMMIELKVNTVEMARAAVEVVRAAGALERVCFGSFGLRALRAIRALEPSASTSAGLEEVRLALYRSRLRWPVTRVRYVAYQVPELSGRTRIVSQRFVQHAHRVGLGVQVWTVNTEVDARRLLDWNVDGLITDRPEAIVPLTRSSCVRSSGATGG